MTWTINPNIEVRIGHQYLQSNPNYVDSSELSFYTYLRLNENWAFSIYEDYEFKTGTGQSTNLRHPSRLEQLGRRAWPEHHK